MSLIRLITFMLLGNDNDWILNVLLDMGHFIGIRRQFNSFLVVFHLITMCSQLVYYYNYRKKINPTFLRVFRMLSGEITPKSLGLIEENKVARLALITKWLYFAIKINNIVFQIFTFILNPIFSYHYLGFLEALYYGVPNGVLLAFFVRYFSNFIFYQCFYFFIICLYLKIKIDALNERLIEMQKNKQFRGIPRTLRSFDSLLSEINEYNTTFWSKFLLLFWFSFGFNITLLLYVIIYLELPFIVRLIFIYALIVYIIIFFTIIFTASSVNYHLKKIYKTLNSMKISYIKHNKHGLKTRTTTGIKV